MNPVLKARVFVDLVIQAVATIGGLVFLFRRDTTTGLLLLVLAQTYRVTTMLEVRKWLASDSE